MKTKIACTISFLFFILYCFFGTVFAADDGVLKIGQGTIYDDRIEVVGVGAPPDSLVGKERAKKAAEMAAMIDALRNFGEVIKEINESLKKQKTGKSINEHEYRTLLTYKDLLSKYLTKGGYTSISDDDINSKSNVNIGKFIIRSETEVKQYELVSDIITVQLPDKSKIKVKNFILDAVDYLKQYDKIQFFYREAGLDKNIEYLRDGTIQFTLICKAPVDINIAITSPNIKHSSELVTSESKMTVSGRVTSSVKVASVTINGQKANLDQDDGFFMDVLLNSGENKILITAKGTDNKQRNERFTIIRKKGPVLPAATHSASSGRFQSEEFRFAVNLPAKWKIIKRGQNNQEFALKLKSPDKSQTISIYAFRMKEKVDIEDLADADVKIFTNLGSKESEKSYFLDGIRTFLFLPTNFIEKVYKSGTYQTKLVFRTNVHYAYIFAWTAKIDDMTVFDKMVSSYEPLSVPWQERWENIKGGIGGWLLIALFALIIGGGFFAFGQMGLYIRRGVELKKSLQTARSDLEKAGQVVDEAKYRKYERKSALYICLPLAVCGILYIILFVYLSKLYFLASLLGIGLVVAGYFGFRFGPDIGEIGEDVSSRA